MNPPHSHSEEEEIFVVLSGAGTVELWPNLRSGSEPERSHGHGDVALRRGATFAAGGHRPRPPV